MNADGEVFYGYAKEILKLHKQAIDRFKEPDLAGEIRFGLPEDFATVFLTDILTEFMKIHPHVLLNIECDLTLNLMDRFKRGEFDMVLVKMSKPEDFPDGIDVWSEKLEWVGVKSSLDMLGKQKIVGEKEAGGKPAGEKILRLVLSPQPCIYRSRALTVLEKEQIRWQIVFNSASYTSKIAAVKAGLGITVLPKSMIPSQLIALKSPQLPVLSDSHISLLKQNRVSSVIASFEEFILKRLKH